MVEKISGPAGDIKRTGRSPDGYRPQTLCKLLGRPVANPAKTRPRLDKWTVAGLAEAILGVGRRKKWPGSFIMGGYLRDIRLFERET